jgi:hypothetical protein
LPARALQTEEIPYSSGSILVRQFSRGARNALAASFDSVEVQGANGHPLEQLFTFGTNRHDNAYGGPLEHRAANRGSRDGDSSLRLGPTPGDAPEVIAPPRRRRASAT